MEEKRKFIEYNDGKDTSIRYVSDNKYKNNTEKRYRVLRRRDEAGDIAVPGLESTNVCGRLCTTMAPQGHTVTDKYILVSAYDFTGQFESVVYIVGRQDVNKVATLILPDRIHAGGIAFGKSAGKNYLFVCDYSLSDNRNRIVAIEENVLDTVYGLCGKGVKSVRLSGYSQIFTGLLPDNHASCCCYFEGKLWVGTFDGKKCGVIGVYDFAEEKKNSLKLSFSLKAPKKLQGISVWREGGILQIATSSSYGKSSSVLNRYFVKKRGTEFVLAKRCRRIKLPPYLEEIFFDGKERRISMVFESSAAKYNRTPFEVDRIVHIPAKRIWKDF